MCGSGPDSRTLLLQLQLHVVQLLLGCGTDGNIYVRGTFTALPFRRRHLGGKNKRSACQEGQTIAREIKILKTGEKATAIVK